MFDFNAVLNAAIRTAVEEAVTAQVGVLVAEMLQRDVPQIIDARIEREIKNQLEIHEIIRPDSPTEAQVETMIERALDSYDFDTVVRDIMNGASLSIDW